jgi:hypothetical protein
MKKKMVHRLLTSLIYATSIITITCLFLRLSKVRILPKAADHTKNIALDGACVHHTLFQGNLLLSVQAKE